MTIPKPVFKPPFNMTRASHVVLHVRDLARSHAFYVDTLGFVVTERLPNRLYLRGLEEACHHSLVLEAASEPACARVGMRVLTDEDLDGAKAHFESHGQAARWVEIEHQRRTLHTSDPAGTPLEICANMDTPPAPDPGGERFQGRLPAASRSFSGADAENNRGARILCRDGISALRIHRGGRIRKNSTPSSCSAKATRTTSCSRRGEGPRLHHTAFVVPETYHLMFVCDQLAENGFGSSVEFGPNRHFAPGFARFVYLRDPDGHRIELFTTHYQTIDSEDEPVRWNVSQLRGGWGGRPPESWFKEASSFDARRR